MVDEHNELCLIESLCARKNLILFSTLFTYPAHLNALGIRNESVPANITGSTKLLNGVHFIVRHQCAPIMLTNLPHKLVIHNTELDTKDLYHK